MKTTKVILRKKPFQGYQYRVALQLSNNKIVCGYTACNSKADIFRYVKGNLTKSGAVVAGLFTKEEDDILNSLLSIVN